MEQQQEQDKQPVAARPPAAANGGPADNATANNGAASASAGGAADDDGEYKDWLTEQLGYRPTLDERLEIARQESLARGFPPYEHTPLTAEQLAAIAECDRRLAAMTLPKAKRKSEDVIREMRDASIGIYPKSEPKS